VKCDGEGLRWRGGGLTSLGASVIRDEECFLCCGAGFLRDKVSVICRRGSVIRGGGSATRDRSSERTGEENERKDEVTQIKTRRWNHGEISEKRI